MASDAKQSVLQMRHLQLPSDCTFKDRVMAINVVGEAQSLDTIDNPVVLLCILIDIIETVQAFYDQGYLHRDLSTSNVGYVHSEDGNVRGVIFDFDMAIKISFLREIPDPAQTQAVGTLPFMAMGLLHLKPDHHDLCHDLESIVWIFITTLAHGSQSNQPIPPLIARMLNAEHRDTCIGAKINIHDAANEKELLNITDWRLVQNSLQKSILESLVYDVLHEVIAKSYKTKPESESSKLIHLFQKAADVLKQQHPYGKLIPAKRIIG